jgi:ornithine cyclodeaminase/alanine dehydrogenase
MGLNRSTLFLNRDAVEKIALPMSAIIDLVEDALLEKAEGRVQMPPKHWLETQDRWFGGMCSLVPKLGYTAMKWQTGSDDNAARNLPYLTGMLFLNNIEDGLVCAIMDSTWITQQRTAAASAVAVKHLANPGETSFAVLGAGVQARSHFEALELVMPALEKVVIYDINPQAAREFAKVVSARGFEPVILDTAREVFDNTSVIISCGRIQVDAERVIEPDWIRPGLTTVAIDYDCYWKPEALHAVDRLFTDDVGQIEHIKSSNYFVGSPAFDGELGDIVAKRTQGRTDPAQSIAVMNLGIAVEDIGSAKAIYEEARRQGIGLELEI